MTAMRSSRKWVAGCGAALAVMCGASGPARAQIVVSANDGKIVLVNGANAVAAAPQPDTVTVLDASLQPPRILGELRVPTSVIGPPQSVAISPNGTMALVTASIRVDSAHPTQMVNNDVVTVIDLEAAPPVVLTTLHAGAGASGVSINRAGTLALVANRQAGSISVFTIAGKTVTPAGTVDLTVADSEPSHVVFTPDGRTALVTRNHDSLISFLSIDGAHVEYTKRDIAAGLKPYGIDITPAGDAAVVGHIGANGTGGVDTLALIDLTAPLPHTIDQVAAGLTVEGLAISPDGRYVAVGVLNGTNTPPTSPFFHDFSRIRIFSVAKASLQPVTEARGCRWPQGVAWSADGHRLLVQCMVDKAITVFTFNGRRLAPAGAVPVPGGAAGIRAAGR